MVMGVGVGVVQCAWLPSSQASTEDLKDWGALALTAFSRRSFHRWMAEGEKDIL